MLQSKFLNDTWSLYQYGNKIKVVYYKTMSNTAGFEKDTAAYRADSTTSSVNPEGRFASSLSRTRARVFELAMCNDFEFFVTCTLDENMRDRYDLTAFRKALAQMIRDLNKNRTEGQKIEYLLLPELHENGAWHMHGLFKGLQVGTDLCKNEHGYLDWFAYRKRFGFFSCSPIQSQEGCSKYITKYVTKAFNTDNNERSTAEAVGGRAHLYFASQGLKRREVLAKYEGGRPPDCSWDFENEYVKIGWINLDD